MRGVRLTQQNTLCMSVVCNPCKEDPKLWMETVEAESESRVWLQC